MAQSGFQFRIQIEAGIKAKPEVKVRAILGAEAQGSV